MCVCVCVCIYNLFASMRLSSPQTIERKKEEVKVVVYFLSLTAHPILFSRWDNLRALTKWESIISVPFNPVARRPPSGLFPFHVAAVCFGFFFFSFLFFYIQA